MSIEGLEITHHDQGDSGEYRATLPGHDTAARLTWKSGGEAVRIANHTLVPSEIRGRGIAAELVDALIADAREEGFRIVPACSYVAKKFDENPDWGELRA